MEKQLNRALLLPLEEIALRKVVIMLWNQMDILAQFRVDSIQTDLYYKLALKVNDRVEVLRNKLPELNIPDLLLKKLGQLLKPIGLQILTWEHFHVKFLVHSHTYFEEEFHVKNFGHPHYYLEETFPLFSETKFDERVLGKLCWTSIGTINYSKTAEQLIRFEHFGVIQRYKLACFYCVKQNNLFEQTQLDSFWGDILREEGRRNNVFGEFSSGHPSFYKCVFMKSAIMGNKAATKYFYQKIASAEKQEFLLKAVRFVARKGVRFQTKTNYLPSEEASEVLRYLVSQMTPEQQTELLKKHAYHVLRFFVEWPWHDVLIDIAELAWEFLREYQYCKLLYSLYSALSILEHKNADSIRFFFSRSPRKFKNYFIEEQRIYPYFIHDLFICEDLEIMKCVLRNVDSEARVRHVFCDGVLRICCLLVEDDKLNLLKLFIQEATLSRKDEKKFKEDFKKYASTYYRERRPEKHVELMDKLIKFDRLMDVKCRTLNSVE